MASQCVSCVKRGKEAIGLLLCNGKFRLDTSRLAKGKCQSDESESLPPEVHYENFTRLKPKTPLFFSFKTNPLLSFHGVEKSIKYAKKMPRFGTHTYVLIRNTLGITKNAHRKYSMFILARNFDCSNLGSKECQKFARKMATFRI